MYPVLLLLFGSAGATFSIFFFIFPIEQCSCQKNYPGRFCYAAKRYGLHINTPVKSPLQKGGKRELNRTPELR